MIVIAVLVPYLTTLGISMRQRERHIVHRFSPRETMKQAPNPLRPRPQPPRVSVGTAPRGQRGPRRAQGHHDRTRRQTCSGVYLGEK